MGVVQYHEHARDRQYVRPPRPLIFPTSAELPETGVHLDLRTSLYLTVRYLVGARGAVGSEQFVYWDAEDPRRCLAPDLMVRMGATPGPFPVWKTWERGAPHRCRNHQPIGRARAAVGGQAPALPGCGDRRSRSLRPRRSRLSTRALGSRRRRSGRTSPRRTRCVLLRHARRARSGACPPALVSLAADPARPGPPVGDVRDERAARDGRQ